MTQSVYIVMDELDGVFHNLFTTESAAIEWSEDPSYNGNKVRGPFEVEGVGTPPFQVVIVYNGVDVIEVLSEKSADNYQGEHSLYGLYTVYPSVESYLDSV